MTHAIVCEIQRPEAGERGPTRHLAAITVITRCEHSRYEVVLPRICPLNCQDSEPASSLCRYLNPPDHQVIERALTIHEQASHCDCTMIWWYQHGANLLDEIATKAQPHSDQRVRWAHLAQMQPYRVTRDEHSEN